MKNNTINKKEIEKFSKIAEEWWDPKGKFKPLHNFNPLRISYLKENIIKSFNLQKKDKILSGVKILDIGCGGGLLCEPMSRLGADVFGMDTFNNFSSIKPKISIVPEQESPPSFLTPREVLELVVNIRQIPDSNIDYWLEFFELETMEKQDETLAKQQGLIEPEVVDYREIRGSGGDLNRTGSCGFRTVVSVH